MDIYKHISFQEYNFVFIQMSLKIVPRFWTNQHVLR